MKNLKYGILGLALIGLVGCFLAFIPGPEGNLSWFDLRSEQGFGSRVIVLMAGFVAALAMGGLSLAIGMKRWMGVVATLGFTAAWVAMEGHVPDLFGFMVGAKLMAVAAIGGPVVALLCAIKPEPGAIATPAAAA